MGHFGTKIAHPDNSGSAGRVFLKWGNKYMRMILIIFQKKSFWGGQMDHFGLKMAHPHNSGSAVRIF